MTYELEGHTADVIVTAREPSLAALFGTLADGLAAAGCEEWPETEGEPFTLTVSADRKEALLYDYLAELIYERDVRGVLPVDNTVWIDPPSASPLDAAATDSTATRSSESSDISTSATGGPDTTAPDPSGPDKSAPDTSTPAESDGTWTLRGEARGVPLERIDAREIKAVTYSEMTIEEMPDGWYGRVVLDV